MQKVKDVMTRGVEVIAKGDVEQHRLPAEPLRLAAARGDASVERLRVVDRDARTPEVAPIAGLG
jgi:hypothetical protein